jgi:hypothetical protein
LLRVVSNVFADAFADDLARRVATIVLLSIINDSSAPAGDRLRAMDQLESRALGKPKETVEHQDGKSEAERMLDRMSTEELEELARSGRHLRALNEEAAAADEPAGAGD